MSTPSRHPLLSWAGLTAAARAWSVESQQVARRNAMLAATACSRRRVERQEVEDFLAERFDAPDDAGEAAESPEHAGATVRHAHG